MADDYFTHSDTQRLKLDTTFNKRRKDGKPIQPYNHNPYERNPVEVMPTGVFKRLPSRQARNGGEMEWVLDFVDEDKP